MWFIKKWFSSKKQKIEPVDNALINNYRPSFALYVSVNVHYKNLTQFKEAIAYFTELVIKDLDVPVDKKIGINGYLTLPINDLLVYNNKEELIVILDSIHQQLLVLADLVDYPKLDSYHGRLTQHLFLTYNQIKEGLQLVTDNINEQNSRYRKRHNR